jgi:hypothetical protein
VSSVLQQLLLTELTKSAHGDRAEHPRLLDLDDCTNPGQLAEIAFSVHGYIGSSMPVIVEIVGVMNGAFMLFIEGVEPCP